ncbi:hypothetical protein [Micromonospora zamorensis]|uniref:hypothetical protein n=1 Tax=Micromonospora zamorensis TaxID=709883 RepID=UPI0033A21A89
MLAVVTGLVHPLRTGWLFDEPIQIIFHDGNWKIIIKQSQFHVFIEGDRPDDLDTFFNEVSSIVQGCLDALGFHLATTLRAETASMIIDGKELFLRNDQWTGLIASPRKFVPPQDLEPFVRAATGDSLIRLALADLRLALEAADDTVMLCFRAIESVRQWFLKGGADEGQARKQSWADMREALGVDEADIRSLGVLALSRRHGAAAPPNGVEREGALRLAREIVARLVAYRASRIEVDAEGQS